MKNSINLMAFVTALSLHLIIGGILLMNVDFSLPKEKPKPVVNVIDASLVSQQLFDDLADKKAQTKRAEQRKKDKIKKEKLRKQRELAAKKKREKAAKDKAAREKAAKVKAAKAKAAKEKAAKDKAAKEKIAKAKAAKQKAAKEKAVKEKAAKEKAAQDKAAREKLAKEKAAKEKAAREKAAKEKAAKAAAAEQERIRQEELDRQMEAEFANEFSSARSAKQLSEIAKFQALIREKISRNWKVEPSMNGKSCTVAIKLASDGFLISATKVSGDSKVCASAIRATQQAKTLPIPNDPEIAQQFRDFDIILEPDL